MADTKKAQTQTQRTGLLTVTPVFPICITQTRLAPCHEQMLVRPGCAAAGLNPHVNSECVPCSQWLSSAATGLQPAGAIYVVSP